MESTIKHRRQKKKKKSRASANNGKCFFVTYQILVAPGQTHIGDKQGAKEIEKKRGKNGGRKCLSKEATVEAARDENVVPNTEGIER